jgi:hypothetical protein
MSLDNVSHLGASGLDELVPSRYALQVGDIDVLVIKRWGATDSSRDDGLQRRLCQAVDLAGRCSFRRTCSSGR